MSYPQQIWRRTKRDKACVTSEHVITTLQHLLHPIQVLSKLAVVGLTGYQLPVAPKKPCALPKSTQSPPALIRRPNNCRGRMVRARVSPLALTRWSKMAKSALIERQPFHLCIS